MPLSSDLVSERVKIDSVLRELRARVNETKFDEQIQWSEAAAEVAASEAYRAKWAAIDTAVIKNWKMMKTSQSDNTV